MCYSDPPPAFDFDAYLDFLEKHHHNFIRLWRWELPKWTERQSSQVRYCAPQMEFPTIQEHIDDTVHADKQSLVLARLPAIIDRKLWRGTVAEGRRVFEAIVAEFGWQILRKEYLAALREFKKQGRAKFTELDDNAMIEFAK